MLEVVQALGKQDCPFVGKVPASCFAKNCDNYYLDFVKNFCGLGYRYIFECRQVKQCFILALAWFKEKNQAILFVMFESIACLDKNIS
jgi:hypothetical protein